MKNPTLNLVLALSLLAIGACGDSKNKNSNTRAGGTGRGGQTVPATTTQLNPSLWTEVNLSAGRIDSGLVATQSNNANNLARIFLSTDWGWAAIGASSTAADPDFGASVFTAQAPYTPQPCAAGKCAVGLSLGVTSGGTTSNPLTFQSGKTLDAAMASGQRELFASGGGITLGFWDSLNGTPDPNAGGAPIPGIPVWIPLQNGSYLERDQIKLVFADELGEVVLTGTLSGSSRLNAQVSFRNNNNVNTTNEGGAPLGSGILGSISTTNVCSFIRCK